MNLASEESIHKTAVHDKILFVPDIGTFGGGERIYLSLSKYLGDQGLSHRIVSYSQRIDLNDQAVRPVVQEELRVTPGVFGKLNALRERLIRASDDNYGFALLFGIQAALHIGILSLVTHVPPYVLIIFDTPSLLTPTETDTRPIEKAKRRARDFVSRIVTKAGMKRAEHVIITTKYMAREIKQLYDVDAIVSYQGVSSAVVTNSYRFPGANGTLTMLSVCRLEHNKRIDWILRSLGQLERANPKLSTKVDWQLDIVGDGTMTGDLRQIARDAGIAHRVNFHGFVSDEELSRLYLSADLFLMPAVQGYGLPALEALTRRVPVILHRQSGVSEILEASPWAEVFDGEEDDFKQALARTVARLMTDDLSTVLLPPFPTETSWAEDVSRICGWVG
jgi:glycosyltransferase involved in cell wall biosynthesis